MSPVIDKILVNICSHWFKADKQLSPPSLSDNQTQINKYHVDKQYRDVNHNSQKIAVCSNSATL